MVFDRSKRLWAVDHDPDSMPPNRLLHVVPTADFGFQFRFGRAGTHALQAWDGELPGTMPMAADASLDIQTRADALAGLSRMAGLHSAIINRSSLPRQNEALRNEARRILNRAAYETDVALPAKEEFEKWDALAGRGGDVDAGRRVFFRKTCVNCHAHNGRGARTGPDLTSLAGQMNSRRALESISAPSKEISPSYVPWRILTVDGRVLTGLKIDAPGISDALRFQAADGNHFEVLLSEIEEQIPVPQSVMPVGLEQSMSLQELRDLVAFLTHS